MAIDSTEATTIAFDAVQQMLEDPEFGSSWLQEFSSQELSEGDCEEISTRIMSIHKILQSELRSIERIRFTDIQNMTSDD